MAQRVDAAGLFRLVHFKRLDLPPGLTRRLITLGIGFRQAVEPGEAVEVRAVLLLVEQLRALVLAVDIQKTRPQRAQLRDRDGPSVRAADVLAVGIDVALEQQHAVLHGLVGQVGVAEQGCVATQRLGAPQQPVQAGLDPQGVAMAEQ